MDPNEFLQHISAIFLSTQYYDTGTTMKTWFDKNNNLQFFITNTPARRPSRPSTHPPTNSAIRNGFAPETPTSTPSASLYINNHSARPDRTPNEQINCSNSVHELGISNENVLAETIAENEPDLPDVEVITLPNVSTKNRFDVLMSIEKPKQPETRKTIERCARLTKAEYSATSTVTTQTESAEHIQNEQQQKEDISTRQAEPDRSAQQQPSLKKPRCITCPNPVFNSGSTGRCLECFKKTELYHTRMKENCPNFYRDHIMKISSEA